MSGPRQWTTSWFFTVATRAALVAALAVPATLWAQSAGQPAAGQAMPASEASSNGVDAYVFGYPLVTMEVTRRVMTNAKAPAGSHAPMGQFVHQKSYPTATFRDVTAPNADTLYSTAWVDLGKQAYVMHVPNMHGRYYLMPLLSAWTDVIASPGTRTTGTGAGDFAITGPSWKGQLPPGVTRIKSPTNLVWILGRTYCNGTPQDLKAVHAIQKQYSLKPLTAFGKPYTPPAGKVDPRIDMETPPREQVNRMDAATYFSTLASLLKDNPTPDAAMMTKLASIGIVPGQDFAMARLPGATATSLQTVPKTGVDKISAHAKDAGRLINNWTVTTKTGDYGTDYLQRAFVAMIGLGANLPEDAVYPQAKLDGNGRPLSGANHYVIHFAKGQTPPVRGFWSLTLYDQKMFFVHNPLNRFALSPRNKLKYNADGSLDLYVQHASPGKAKESNWLPAPADAFTLMLRLYWPARSVIEGTWQPPPVKRG